MAAIDLAYDLYDCSESDSDACPIILMHGLFWNKFVYKDIAENLCHEMKCKVYCLDLRNHGESSAPKGLTIDLMAEDVKKFLLHMGLKKVHFVCHSLSSSVAYLVLLEQPEVVQKIVMIDYSPFSVVQQKYSAENVIPQVATQNRILKSLDPKMSIAQAKSKFYSLAAMGNKSQEYFYKKAAYDLTKVNGEFKWRVDIDYILERYLERHLSIEPRGSSDHEILVLRCVNSARVPDEKFETILKHNPKVKMVTFEDTTHILMFERQEKFVEIVKEFLSSTSDDIPVRRTV